MADTGFNPTDEAHLAEIRDQVKERYRLADIDNLLTIPLDNEIDLNVFDSISEINAQPPETNFTLDSIMTATNFYQYRSLLYLGVAAKVLSYLAVDWSQNGLDSSVLSGDIEIPNRFSDIVGEAERLTSNFYERLEKYKEASEKYAVGVPQKNQRNYLFGTPALRSGNNTTGCTGRLY